MTNNKYVNYKIINEEGKVVAQSRITKDSDISSILELIEELNYIIEIREEL
tara:strand:+ start:285 stop:437 length:153 start_codon:yes stop_codon:yes gene_type:complete